MSNPPVPLEVKRLRGNPGKRHLPDISQTHTLSPALRVPDPPATLEATGRDYWELIWSRAKWLSPDVDSPGISEVCHAIDEVARMRALVLVEGDTLTKPIVTPAGILVGEETVAHPLKKELHEASKQLRSWMNDYGFTPAARAKLGLAEIKSASALEELMRRRAER